MTTIRVKENEPFDVALRRFKRTIEKLGLLTDLRATAKETQGFVANLNGAANILGPDLAKAVEKLRETADHAATVSAQVDQMLADNRGDLRAFIRDGLPQLQQTLREARSAIDDARSLTRGLNEDPSRILFQPTYRGVEIPP
jgi:ABC-type transporter Mla subunit MlaD